MKIAFVSSMNKSLYDFYGKRFLEEFAKSASQEILLFIIFEGKYPEEILTIGENIIVVPLMSESHSLFLNKFGKLEEAKGLKIKKITENGQKKLSLSYDFRFNAIRFSFKPFSIHQCLEYLPNDITHLIWTDADLRCKKKFNSDDLIDFLPHKSEIMSYLGRKDSYSECGFLGFNMCEKNTLDYIGRMIEIYTSGDIFSLDQWHDSFIWDHVRLEFESKLNCKFKDISGDGAEKEHVYINTNLNEYFDHLKGPERKQLGSSKPEDYERGIINTIKVK